MMTPQKVPSTEFHFHWGTRYRPMKLGSFRFSIKNPLTLSDPSIFSADTSWSLTQMEVSLMTHSSSEIAQPSIITPTNVSTRKPEIMRRGTSRWEER